MTRNGTWRVLRLGLLGVAAASLSLLAFSGVASAGTTGTLTVTVTKVVTGGTPPAGAAYTVTVSCAQTSGGAITASGASNFAGPGGPTTVINASLASGSHPFCGVVENVNGGASSTTITCARSTAPAVNICTNGNFDLINPLPGQTVIVTVTNNFPADPAAPVVVRPRFTG